MGHRNAEEDFEMDRNKKSVRVGVWAIVLGPLLSFVALICAFVLLRQPAPENEIPSLQPASGYTTAPITVTNSSESVATTNSAL